MKIARVLLDQADPEPPRATVALERDGALYDVGELDRRFGTRFSPDAFLGATDFHTRVIALACAGLDALDERLRAGDRPTEARILPGTFLWLPPCDPDRALYVQMAPYDAALDEPSYRIGNARGLLGHDALVPFPARETRPDFELGIAAVLAEDLHAATADEAARAILGYAILNDWTARDEAARAPLCASSARDFATQLGPTLVTRDEVGDVARLKAQARVGGAVITRTSIGGFSFSLAESIAYVSRHVPLRAGDVIGAGRVIGGSASEGPAPLRFDAPVELAVERLGKLAGRPARGREPPPFRLA